MSIMNLVDTIFRAKHAERCSPVAIFKTDQHGKYDVVFERTVKTKAMIKNNHPDLIGVFDCTSDFNALRRALNTLII